VQRRTSVRRGRALLAEERGSSPARAQARPPLLCLPNVETRRGELQFAVWRALRAVVGGWWRRRILYPISPMPARTRSKDPGSGVEVPVTEVGELRNQSGGVVSSAHRLPFIGAKICVARHYGRVRRASRPRTALGFVQVKKPGGSMAPLTVTVNNKSRPPEFTRREGR